MPIFGVALLIMLLAGMVLGIGKLAGFWGGNDGIENGITKALVTNNTNNNILTSSTSVST